MLEFKAELRAEGGRVVRERHRGAVVHRAAGRSGGYGFAARLPLDEA